MIISLLLLLFFATCPAQDLVKRNEKGRFLGEAGDAPFYAYPDQLPAAFCVKHRLTCVLDITSPRVHCDFSSPIRKELDAATFDAGRRLLEKQCRGNRWRIVDGIHIFEPRNEKESALSRKIGAYDSGSKVSPNIFIYDRAVSAGLRQPPGYGLGIKPADKSPYKFKTPEGTLKATLISAAKQYRGGVWAIALVKDGYIFTME